MKEKATAQIFLDGKQAEAAIDGLKQKSIALKAAIIEAGKAGDQVTMKKLQSELKGVESAEKTLKKEAFDVQKVLNNINGSSFTDLGKALAKANRELKLMKQNDPGFDAKRKEVDQLRAAYNRAGDEIKGTSGIMGKIKVAAGGMLPAFGWAAIATGAIAAAKAVFDFANRIQEARQQVQKLTGLKGKDLADLTAGLSATSQTFGKDMNELALANHNFAKSMGISEQAANSLINKGFLAGADSSGEFLDQIKEYGPQFKAAGLSAEQAIAVISQSVQEGIWSDKGADTIKEAGLRLREMTPATQAALEGIGISSKEMMNQLSTGQISVFEATQQVSRKMAELPPQSSKVGTAIADIFGGAGEDAGLGFITMLGNASSSMDDLVKKTGETGEANQKLLEANQKLSQAWSDLLGTGTSTFTSWNAAAKSFLADAIVGSIKGIQELRNWFIDFYNKSLPLRALIQYIGLSFKTMFQYAKTGWLEFLNVFQNAGKILKAVFTGDFKVIPNLVKEAFDNAKNIASNGAEAIADDFELALKNVKSGEIKIPPVVVGVELSNEIPGNKTATNKPNNQKNNSSNIGITKSNKNAKNEAIEAINIGYEKEKLALKENYAGKEELEKEFQARMIANDLAYLNAKLNLTNNETERLSIQQAIIDKETEYKAAIESALIPMLAKKEAQEELNNTTLETSKLTTIATQKTQQAIQAQEQLVNKLQGNAEVYKGAIQTISQGVYDMASGSEGALKKFGKSILKFALEQLKIQAEIAAAGATVQSLAQADSISTFGATGLIRAAIIVGLIEAAFAGLDALVDNFAEGGFTRPGGKYEPAGIVHAGEFVVSQEGVNNPAIKPILDNIDFAQRNGTLSQLRVSDAVVREYGSQPAGFSSGGFVRKTNSGKTNSDSVSSANNNQLNELISSLNTAMTENTKASREMASKRFEINANEIFKVKGDYDTAVRASEM